MFWFCKSQGIRKTFSSIYNPTSNALSERINQNLAVGLRILKGNTIEQALSWIENSFNFSYHRRVGQSPFELINNHSPFDPLSRRLEIDIESVNLKAKKEAERELSKRNKGRYQGYLFNKDDMVYTTVFRRDKLSNYWEGPFKVVKANNEKNCCLVERNGKQIWLNIKNLRPVFEIKSALS